MNKAASRFVKIVQHYVFEVNRIEERSVQSKVLAMVAAIALDPEQLWEALLNLIRNAVDAMPGGGNPTIATKRNGTKALVSISDNGHGITEEEARNLFIPFFTTKTDGTGLGLAHTQQIVNEHGGRIDWTTKRGEGSTFTIQLPLAVGP